MRNNLLSILNDLYQKENSLRDSSSEFDEQTSYYIIISLLLFLYYKEIINIKKNLSIDDIERVILTSDLSHKNEILNIWKENKDKYPYTNQFIKILSLCDFSKFQTNDDKITFANWVVEKYLFAGYWRLIHRATYSDTVFEIVSKCEKQLDIEFNKGNILVKSDNYELIKKILILHSKDCKYTFYGHPNPTVLIYKILFDSNFSFLDYEDEHQFFPSSSIYDGVILEGSYNDKFTLKKTSVLNQVVNNGFALIFNYDNTQPLEEDFFKYEVPLMFEHGEMNTILIKKTKDESSLVRYGYCQNPHPDIIDDDYLIEDFIKNIKNRIITDDYQELTKEDFIVTQRVKFDDVIHDPDQINFIWKKIKDVISIVEDNEEWLYNTNVNKNQIIDIHELSSNPFNISADSKLYLHNFENKKGVDTHILSDMTITINGHNLYIKPSKYKDLIYDLYGWEPKKEIEPEKKIQLDKSICCRIIKSPCFIYSMSRILRVDNATESNPVCIRKYRFSPDPDEFIHFEERCNAIRINPDYDENFIIYQLLSKNKSHNSEYILVAPSKEEQHTYFLNKRQHYIANLQPVVDEIEKSVNKSIAESQARVTGIGFKNFRCFPSLPNLQFNGVNILVGGNNAGKSSLVKGMLLTIDNIKNFIVDNNENSLISPTFHFNTRTYHDVRIGTFNRSYSHNAIKNETEPNRRTMSFSLSCSHFSIELTAEAPHYSQNDQSTSTVPISSIHIKDNKRNAEFTFDYKNMCTITNFYLESEHFENVQTGLKISVTKVGDNLMSAMIRSIISPENQHFTAQDKQLNEKLNSKTGFIREIADELEHVIKNINVEYIYAHGVNQKVLFNINDKNDYMAQTLHNFVEEKTGDVEKEFIKKCLVDFGIGTDFDVHSIGGEAYIIQIKNKKGEMVYLADLGMGTNQLIILIFRLAIIIHKQRMQEATPYIPTIIIEEPEQNMHPAFQSKLATLFYEVNRDYGFSFIVETHSEYLVRKTQVIVAQQKYAEDELKKQNPFSVYYFPSEGLPYEMEYRTDGNFSNEFGTGFYDEANNLLFEII